MSENQQGNMINRQSDVDKSTIVCDKFFDGAKSRGAKPNNMFVSQWAGVKQYFFVNQRIGARQYLLYNISKNLQF